MDKMLKLKHKSENTNFISLFLPGFPGEYKDRQLFEDLKSYKSDIYSLVYPGTYHENGEFSLNTVISSVKNALQDLKKFNKPILLIAYSFSTLFVSECINGDDNIMGVLAFSPITDLKSSINEDFLDTLKSLKTANKDGFNINFESFEEHINTNTDQNYSENFNKLNIFPIPVFFFLGEKDTNVKTNKVYSLINQLKINKKLVYMLKDGEHRLDSLYNTNYVKNVILALIMSFIIRQISNKVLGVFLWGSTLNYQLDNGTSDLDLIIIGDGFSYEFIAKINQIKSEYESVSKTKIDLVYNSLKEINSNKIIRRNRGVLFTHEINFDYFPLYRNFKIRKTSYKALRKDVLSMYYSSIYHARKSILNYDFKSDHRKLNIKNFIYNCKNYLYLEGFNSPNLDDALKFFNEKNINIFKTLQQCIEIKKSNYENLPKDFDIEITKLIEQLFSTHLKNSKNDWFFEESIK